MTEVPLFAVATTWPVLSIVGPDASTWLNGIVTCDTTSVAPGLGAWGLLLTKTGKVQAELQLLGRSDRLAVAVSGGTASDVAALLEHYLVMEDAELSLAPDQRFVCFYGLGALEAARTVAALEEGSEYAAMPWATDLGAALVTTEAALPSLLDRARSLGARVESELPAAARVALGVPNYGVDFGARDNPHEASLERRAINWSKGCYLGQEVVCMQDMRGKVKRRLVRLEGADVPWESGSEVLGGEAISVGHVTTVGGSQAIASVTAPWFEPGVELSVLGRPVAVLPLSAAPLAPR